MSDGLERPVAEPSEPIGLSIDIERLENRSFTTYKSRLKAHQRLYRRNVAWNSSLVSLATSTTIASVGLLVDRTMFGARGETLMVVLAILSLVISLVVSSVNYGSRSRAMESSYKKIQQLSFSAEALKLEPMPSRRQKFFELKREYEIAVDSSENHSEADYYRHLRGQPGYQKTAKHSRAILRDDLVSLVPYVTLAVPVSLTVPLAVWFINGI